jgi:putative oxidoreductase
VYPSLLLLILRVVAGAGLALHGYPKVKGGRVQAGQWMKSMGVPAVSADLVTVLEFVGGIFLVVGLLTRIVAVFFVIQFASITLMKYSKMHAKFVQHEQGKPSFEIDVLYLLLSLAFLFLGAGTYSVDHFIGL